MKKILTIDNQEDNLTSISAVLKNGLPDTDIITALSGREGLKLAAKELPDTIILDIKMPEMDGFEVCKRLKSNEQTKYISIIMLTTVKTDSESRVKGLELGADYFFDKNEYFNELISLVENMDKNTK